MRDAGWKRAALSLGTCVSAFVLMQSAIGLAEEVRGVSRRASPAGRPVPVQVASVQGPGTPTVPEEIEPTAGRLVPLAPIDGQIVEQTLQRPQPAAPPISVLEPGEAWLQGPGTTRLWGTSVSMWEAPALCHRPLYFEDENLERHGRSLGLLQPAASAAHFAGRAAIWPYLAGSFSPHECIYTLGRERPGSCTDYRLYRHPVSLRGAVYQGAAVTGLSFVVP
jgi:hypothetical protein